MSLLWQPLTGPWLIALVALAAAAWTVVVRRHLRRRWGSEAWWLLTPKLLALGLILLALLGPAHASRGATTPRTLLALIDQSSSMDVVDPGRGESRRARAAAILDHLRLPASLTLTRVWCDTALHDVPAPAGDPSLRGTDLAACLRLALHAQAGGACAGVLLLSDGGDTPIELSDVPGVPILTVGMGSDLAGADNRRIASAEAPATAERGVAFPCTVDVRAEGSDAFLARAQRVGLVFERLEGAQVHTLDREVVDLSHGRARVQFRRREDQVGLAHFRLRLAEDPQELTTLDNTREFAVEVRERALHVLYLSRSLGQGFKPLRAELARDGGISFTALLRTIGGALAARTGERFTLQGARIDGDAALEAGLPTAASAYAPYDCVILGSFPAASWSAASQQALADWVGHGGALIWEGGEDSFGAGGYAGSPLAPLAPWQLTALEPPLARGAFPVGVPAAALAQPLVAGLPAALGPSAALASLNQPGPLRAGAQALVEATSDAGTVAVVALQRFGAGKVLGIASDTWWRLGTGEQGASAIGTFWRQAVRLLADKGEGGQVLRVTWDRPTFAPGATANATIRASVPGVRLLAHLDGPLAAGDLVPTQAPDAVGPAWALAVPLPVRGDYRLRLVAQGEQGELERYEKLLHAAPDQPEGAHLARDDDGLERLATTHQGTYVPEERSAELAGAVARLAQASAPLQVRSLVFGQPWWLVALLLCLAWEWILRRRWNLL